MWADGPLFGSCARLRAAAVERAGALTQPCRLTDEACYGPPMRHPIAAYNVGTLWPVDKGCCASPQSDVTEIAGELASHLAEQVRARKQGLAHARTCTHARTHARKAHTVLARCLVGGILRANYFGGARSVGGGARSVGGGARHGVGRGSPCGTAPRTRRESN